jgi:hypothetical protein
MPKHLFLFIASFVFFKSFSQDVIVQGINREIKSISLSELHAQSDTGYRHNPKGERIGIILDTAFFDSKKRLAMFTRNMKYKSSDSVERGSRQIVFFLNGNRYKVIDIDLNPEGNSIDTAYFKNDKLISANREFAQIEILYWTSSLKEYKANIEFNKRNKFLQ